MVHVAKWLTSLLLTPTCILCGDSSRSRSPALGDDPLDLCAACSRTLPMSASACPRCAEPGERATLCGRCMKKPPLYDGATCALRYQYPIDHLVRAFKYHGRLVYGRTLAELLASRLLADPREDWPEVMVPVPLATPRFRERGFNQAAEIGAVLRTRLGIPLRTDWIARTRNTQEQSGLEAKERRKNLDGAFATIGDIKAKHVAIIDDVITTGSTMNELARTLRRTGVERIDAWALARTPRS